MNKNMTKNTFTTTRTQELLNCGFVFVTGSLLIGCGNSVETTESVKKNNIRVELEDQNIREYLFRDFEDFYSNIYFFDGLQPTTENQNSFFFEIDDVIEKTGIEEFKAKRFYELQKDNPEILRAMILRLNRARWVKEILE